MKKIQIKRIIEALEGLDEQQEIVGFYNGVPVISDPRVKDGVVYAVNKDSLVDESECECEENICEHENLNTTHVMSEPNLNVAICPDCELIVKVIVEAYDPSKHGVKEIESRFETKKEHLGKPKKIEKLDDNLVDCSQNMISRRNRAKINEIIDWINK